MSGCGACHQTAILLHCGVFGNIPGCGLHWRARVPGWLARGLRLLAPPAPSPLGHSRKTAAGWQPLGWWWWWKPTRRLWGRPCRHGSTEGPESLFHSCLPCIKSVHPLHQACQQCQDCSLLLGFSFRFGSSFLAASSTCAYVIPGTCTTSCVPWRGGFSVGHGRATRVPAKVAI